MLNVVDLAETGDSHEFSEIYESLLDGLQAMGKYGEFHTPKAITQFGVDKVNPRLGETMADWACGTGGFMVDTVENLRKQIPLGNNDAQIQLQNSVRGGEFKPMPFRLCITNLLLHGIDLPNVRYGDSLDIKNFSEYFGDDLVDVACLNPPYGGIASDSDKMAFPADMRSSETADLFVALTVKRLKKNGRAIVVVPDGFLFGDDNAKIEIKKYLMKECNLHTVIRLPQSCFAPYTSIATNLLFFDKTGSTEEIWFYRLDMPEGYKHFSKTKPMKREHFAPCDEWWDNRVEIKDEKTDESQSETFKAKKYTIQEIENDGYKLDKCGYPVEEKIIFSPEETIKNYIEKKTFLENELSEATINLQEYINGNRNVELLNIGSLTKRISKLDSEFPGDIRDAILQAAMEGKLTNCDNYNECNYGDLFEISGGSQPAKSKFVYSPKEGYIQLYQTRDYGPNPQPVYIPEKFATKKTKDGDILLARYGGSLGKVFWAKDGAYNVAMAKVIFNKPELHNPKFVYYYHLSSAYQNFCASVTNGRSAQAGFNKEDIYDLQYNLFSLEEQQRIVDLLDKVLPLCDAIV